MCRQNLKKNYLVFEIEKMKGKIIELNSTSFNLPSAFGLNDGTYFILRSHRSAIVLRELQDASRIYRIILPTPPSPSTLVPVGRIEVSRDNVRICSGWPGRAARESIQIQPYPYEELPRVIESCITLKGFERIFFQGNPPVTAWFIPSVSVMEQRFWKDGFLRELSESGFFISAAVGWEWKGEYEEAEKCWEYAIALCREEACSVSECAEVDLNYGRFLKRMAIDLESKEKYEKAEQYWRRASERCGKSKCSAREYRVVTQGYSHFLVKRAIEMESKKEFGKAERYWKLASELCEAKICSARECQEVILGYSRFLVRRGLQEQAMEMRRSFFKKLKVPDVEYRLRWRFVEEEGDINLLVQCYVEMLEGEVFKVRQNLNLKEVYLECICPDLGINERYVLSMRKARIRDGKRQWVRYIKIKSKYHEPGIYKMKITISLREIGVLYEYQDVIGIPKQRSRVVIKPEGDVGAISISGEEGGEYLIEPKGDTGLIRVVMKGKN